MALVTRARLARAIGGGLVVLGVVWMGANLALAALRGVYGAASSLGGPMVLGLGLAMVLCPGRGPVLELDALDPGRDLRDMLRGLRLVDGAVWALGVAAGVAGGIAYRQLLVAAA